MVGSSLMVSLQTLQENTQQNDKIMTSDIVQSLNRSSALGYTVYRHMYLPHHSTIGSSCFSVPVQTASMGFVNKCMQEEGMGTCCMHLEQIPGSGMVVSVLSGQKGNVLGREGCLA